MNWYIFLTAILLIILQGIFAYIDGYLTRGQMIMRHGYSAYSGYSLTEHGGMWADVFIISPLVAHITGTYRFAYMSWWSILILIGAVTITICAGYGYRQASVQNPEAHCHNGKTTMAGWIHGIFAAPTIWILVLFYFTPASPQVSKNDLVTASTLLTPFFFMGVVKWNRWWFLNFGNGNFGIDQFQTFAGPMIVWTVTILRLWLIDHS